MNEPSSSPEPTTSPADSATRSPTHVVGIGASAGGLEALETFFDHAPCDSGLAYVVVQHLSPDYKSLMVELLSKRTRMPVRRADEGIVVEADCVYLIPPKKNLEIAHGRLKLTEKNAHATLNLPIDIFFRSLAEERGDRAIGVILSGTGSDGMRGVRAIKEVGGLAIVQDPASARFDGMPRSAISTGLVDYVSPPEEMPAQLVRYASHHESARRAPPATLDLPEEGVPAVLAAVKRQTGVDFTHYKPGTIVRRIERRMHVTQCRTVAEYLVLVRESARETTTLFKELLIGVTKFFRDTEAFDVLSREVIEPLVVRAGVRDTLRVWVPGCATGEEALTLAMLFHEQLDQHGRSVDLKIFATDIDRDAIELASSGVYPESISADVSPARLARFFVRKGDSYHVVRSLRESVIFAVHNLVKDAPFSRVDLVSCRNLLIYFDPVLQRRALSLMHFALKPSGHLFLGASETVADLPDHFRPLDARAKLFHRVGPVRTPIVDLAEPSTSERPPVRRVRAEPQAETPDAALAVLAARADMADEFAPAALLITERHDLVHVFGDASRYLSVPRGAATHDALEMLPRSMVSLVALGMQKALRDDAAVSYRGVPVEGAEGERTFGVRIKPVREPGLRDRYVLVQLEPAASRRELAGEGALDVAAQGTARLDELQAELQFAQENLRATIEELETSNEELQATNEELLASNEELQSTNEELQSVNEELLTVNAEYQAKIIELTELSADVDNLLRSTSIATLFLDQSLQIRRFTPDVAALVHLMPRDVGRSVQHLQLSFDAPWWITDLTAVVGTRVPRERAIALSDGRQLLVRMLPYLGESAVARGVVVTFVDVTPVHVAQRHLQDILDSLVEEVAVVDANGVITHVNAAWRAFAVANGAMADARTSVGADYLGACRSSEDALAHEIAVGLERVLRGETERFDHEYPCHGPGVQRWYLMHATPLPARAGAVVSHIDISARKLAELELRRALEAARPAGPESPR